MHKINNLPEYLHIEDKKQNKNFDIFEVLFVSMNVLRDILNF